MAAAVGTASSKPCVGGRVAGSRMAGWFIRTARRRPTNDPQIALMKLLPSGKVDVWPTNAPWLRTNTLQPRFLPRRLR